MIYAGSRELYETVSCITEFKNKSGFATYYHMKLLLIFRKYRERYFLHNKKILQIEEVSENEFNLWKKPENHYMGRIA